MDYPTLEDEVKRIEVHRAFLQYIKKGESASAEQKALAQKGLHMLAFSQRLAAILGKRK